MLGLPSCGARRDPVVDDWRVMLLPDGDSLTLMAAQRGSHFVDSLELYHRTYTHV